ncbi:flocculation protein FLO11-like [Branchiostoma floridae]|uniref:Flocculation protein FLO11-like n=1 Tax=Branchiostoma floridae TaxID=7739 RepID=A0A9J7HJA6_BRAFL|nr:flocculation protein FLO11-like [Branchiostoma floridae]
MSQNQPGWVSKARDQRLQCRRTDCSCRQDRLIKLSQLESIPVFVDAPIGTFIVRMDTATATLQDIRQAATKRGKNITNCLFTTPDGEVIRRSMEYLLQYEEILHASGLCFLRMEWAHPKDTPTLSSTTSESPPPIASIPSDSPLAMDTTSCESFLPSTPVQSQYFNPKHPNVHHLEAKSQRVPPMANNCSESPPPSMVGKPPLPSSSDPPPELYPIFTKKRKWTCTSSMPKFHVYSQDDIANSTTDKEKQYKQLWNSIGEEEAVQSMTKVQMQEEVNERWRTIKAQAADPTPTPTTMTSTTVVTHTTSTPTSTTTVTVTTTVTTVTTTPLLDQLPGLRAQLDPDKEHLVENNLQRYFDNPEELDKVVEVIRRRHVKKGVSAGFVKHHILKLTVS